MDELIKFEEELITLEKQFLKIEEKLVNINEVMNHIYIADGYLSKLKDFINNNRFGK